MLLHLDLTLSLNKLSRSRLLAKLEPVLNDPFFPLSINEDGREWSAEAGGTGCRPSRKRVILFLFR